MGAGLTTVVVVVGLGGATTVVVGTGAVAVGAAVPEQLLTIVAGFGPFWIGLHPGSSRRSVR